MCVLNHIGTLATVPVTSPRIFMWVSISKISRDCNYDSNRCSCITFKRYGNTADYAAMIKDLVRRFPSTKVFWDKNLTLRFRYDIPSSHFLSVGRFSSERKRLTIEIKVISVGFSMGGNLITKVTFLSSTIKSIKKSMKVNYTYCWHLHFLFLVMITKCHAHILR